MSRILLIANYPQAARQQLERLPRRPQPMSSSSAANALNSASAGISNGIGSMQASSNNNNSGRDITITSNPLLLAAAAAAASSSNSNLGSSSNANGMVGFGSNITANVLGMANQMKIYSSRKIQTKFKSKNMALYEQMTQLNFRSSF